MFLYRLLGQDESIQIGDEFLNDDCETWTVIKEKSTHGFVIGYKCKNLKPFRRPTTT